MDLRNTIEEKKANKIKTRGSDKQEKITIENMEVDQIALKDKETTVQQTNSISKLASPKLSYKDYLVQQNKKLTESCTELNAKVKELTTINLNLQKSYELDIEKKDKEIKDLKMNNILVEAEKKRYKEERNYYSRKKKQLEKELFDAEIFIKEFRQERK